MSYLKIIAASVAVLSILTGVVGCASQEQGTPQADKFSNRELPTEICIINDTEIPMEIRWESARIRNDGDKIGKYAITKSNSGKVCGAGQEYFADYVRVKAANVLIRQYIHAEDPAITLKFFDKTGAQICETINSYLWSEGQTKTFGCLSTVVEVTEERDTRLRNFLVKFTHVQPDYFGNF